MNYLLLNKFGRPSIKAISKLMKQEHRIVYIDNHPVFTDKDMVIRWATSAPCRFNGAIVYNKARGIALSSKKSASRRTLQDNNISVPKTWWNIDDIKYPVIARPPHHRKGNDFYIVNNKNELTTLFLVEPERFYGFYFSQIIDKTNEYRVHIAHGKVLLIHEKPLVEGEIRGNQHITGLPWGNVIKWDDYKAKMCKLACDAVKCIGLDTGAVDIIKGKDKKYYVCEINTAPTLNDSPYSIQRYAKYFDWLFREKREWYNYTKYTMGKSFAFKNNQLEG